MKQLVEFSAQAMIILAWLAGIALAQGWWKLLAIFVPPYGWYLLVEMWMRKSGMI